MTWALCDNRMCVHHDGDSCTLEQVSLRWVEDDGLQCADWDLDEEAWAEAERAAHEEEEAEAAWELDAEKPGHGPTILARP